MRARNSRGTATAIARARSRQCAFGGLASAYTGSSPARPTEPGRDYKRQLCSSATPHDGFYNNWLLRAHVRDDVQYSQSHVPSPIITMTVTQYQVLFQCTPYWHAQLQ